ncbi:hypothetical protein BV22DRAFT_790298 [Leucogyrophana mollusca]|uniref:Uncharacterized protein n=1 Tax=Leucogyrophana mollusca TaxID=85980 RepID=A0ACB8B5U6_9AGAM|nr:hypothetical protein BV22DRAFT_790298 [Leucogyrophana mollusca]
MLVEAALRQHRISVFNFVPGLGACGYTNTSTQFVASVPSVFFHSFPGAGANPNDNPICTYDVTIIHNTTSVTAQIVDYCTQCADTSIGLSTSAFAKFADPSVGVVNNVSWAVTST